MKHIMILVYALSASVIFAQTTEDEVINSIPDSVLHNPSLKKMINVQMKLKAEIHPELSYYYLRYLKTFYTSQSKQDIRAAYNSLNQTIQFYKIQRSAWAENQLQQSRINLNRPLYGLVAPYFHKYKLKSAEKKLPAGISAGLLNEMNYLVYYHYKQDTTITYYPQEIYSSKRAEIESATINNLNEYYQQRLPAINHIDYDKIEEMLHYWYLFDTDSVNKIKPKFDFESYEFIARYYLRQLIGQKITISFGYSFYNTNISYNRIPEFLKVNKSMKRNQGQIVLGLDYHFLLRDDYVIFSHLNFGFYVAKHITIDLLSSETPEPYVLKYNQNDHLIIENLTYDHYNLRGKGGHSIFTSINTPLIYFSGNGHVNLGVQFGCNWSTYHHFYKYRYRKTENWIEGDSHIVRILADFSADDNTKKVDQNYFIFPSIDFFFPFWQNLLFKITGSYTYGAISLAYNL